MNGKQTAIVFVVVMVVLTMVSECNRSQEMHTSERVAPEGIR